MSEYRQPNKDTLIKWAKTALTDTIIEVEDVAATAFSYVLKINTSKGNFYLKKTPPKLYIEANVIDILNADCGLENVPTIIAKNDDLHCFLMPSCGDFTLRTLFQDRIEKDLLYKGTQSYVDLQKGSSAHIRKFIDIGVSDWRIEMLPNIYAELINDEERLAEWGINTKEQQRSKSSQELFLKLCAELKGFNLPDVLNHSDFHPNAMLLDKEANEIKIIDLGEVTIGNPLLPLASCITNYLEHRWNIRADADEYDAIKASILEQWNLRGDDVMDLVEIIGPLNYTLTFRKLMELCGHNFPKWHKWIKLAFFEYLDNLERRYG